MSKRRELARLRQAAEAGDIDATLDLADILMDAGDLSGAERFNRRAAEAGNHDGIVDLGVVLLKMGRYEEAERWLRKGLADPRHAETPGFCEAVLGKCLINRGQLDEAERLLSIGADAGIGFAIEALEKLREERANGRGSDVRQAWKVDSVMFYDGSGHRLGPSICTLTRMRLIIDDARGGISQILLRDISGVSTPAQITSPKQLRITAPGVAYDIYCVSKDQKYDFEVWLSGAIRGA